MNRIITLLALLIGVFGYSQVGIGTPKPSESAELEILSANKGILIPRIALKSIDDTTTIENGNVNSLLIFNTTDEDDLKPGYYYWYENRWVRMINQSDDVLKAPWQIQNTENQSTANTEHIYQQGKVAVGFTKDDEVSDKQFEVKGDVKALYGKTGGIYELFETGIDVPLNSGTAFFDEHKGNFLGHIDSESLFTGNTPSYNFLSGLLTSRQTHENGNILGTSTLSTDIKDRAFAAIHTSASDLSYGKTGGVQLIANQGGYLGRNKTEILLNSDSQVNGFNGIDMSVIGESDQDITKIKVDLKKGIGLFTSSEASGSIAGFGLNDEDGVYYFNKGGVYVFPKEGGIKNQVLSVNDATTITDANYGGIPAQALVWKDVSDLVSQPWKIQATDSIASLSTQNIYQQGKVAVGFTKDDDISNKQFEVKGDAKFLSEKKVGNESLYNLLETNSYPTSGSQPYNFFMTSNKPSLLDNPDVAFGFMTDPMNGMASRLFTKYLGTEISIETNANNDGQFRLYTYKSVEGNSVNLEGDDHHGLHMYVDKRENGSTKVHLNAADGVGFSFKENIHGGEGYVFPRNKGVKNQVLTVGDEINTAIDSNMNALVWKDVSDLVSQPWKIQATDSIASLNTQNIFQKGKVAVGFSKDDIVSEKQLEVKGDIKALNQLASGFYNWVESGINTSSVGIDPEKAAINIFGTFKDHSLLGIASQTTNGTGLITEITKEDNVHGNINSFSSGLKSIGGDGSYLSEVFSNVIENSQSEPIVGVTLRTVNLEKEENSAISLTPSKISLENHYAGQKGASVHIEGKKGITFGYDGSMNYTFPTYTGNANQVLTVKDAISNTDLVWKNVSDLVSQPWKIQNTENQSTANTENIYQQGKVALGFTKDDEVSNRQLDVKGDVRIFDKGANNYSGFLETTTKLASQAEGAESAFGTFKNVPESRTPNRFDDGSGTFTSLVNNNYMYMARTNMTFPTGKFSNRLLLNSQPGKSYFDLNASEVDGTLTNDTEISIIGETSPGRMYLFARDKTDGNSMVILKDAGIAFYSGLYGINIEGYVFPRSKGAKNQILTVGDPVNLPSSPFVSATNALVWKDVSDLVSQPWKIQGTDSIALQNTQNIYQMGSVAVGVNSIPSFTVGTETINPKLHVAGDVSATGKFWTTNSVYADYVFEKYFNGESAIKNDYEFMTLDYIKEFVKTNKHLPGVTPIKDLQKSESGYSFNITGLTVELLEKTEELFLHTIEQQQQIDELKSQVEENNRRLKMLEELFLNSSK